MAYDPDTGAKRLTTEELIAALSSVPTGSVLACNGVENLVVLDEVTLKYRGYIDFSDGRYQPPHFLI